MPNVSQAQLGGRPIAIVGLSVQLPSGGYAARNLDYNSLWDFLLEGGEAYESIPRERLTNIAGEIPHAGGSFLKDTTKFDNLEFGIANKDAKALTASTRRLIELSFLALLDSGIDSRGQKIGSFMTGTNSEYFEPDDVDDRGFGGTPNTLANRVSYTLDLRGPSLYLDTACSSTLTAFHLAIRAIRNGDCDAAVVGGCQHNMNLWDWIVYGSGGIMSPDSKCKPFDASANGFAKAEGAVAFVLKPLDTALADNDHIYTVVLGSAINSNGSRAPIHAPSGVAQQDCIRAAYQEADRDPKDADFVELHATGTAVGDPIECNAAGPVFARSDDVVVGSIKGNLGHLEVSAFFGSLAKVCLIFENKIIPPNVNFNTPNPKILWDQYGLKVPTEPIPLGCHSASGRSLISLASSGIGGSNGHVVTESPPPSLPSQSASLLLPDTPVLFVVGGLSPRAAQEIAESLLRLLSNDSSANALSQAVTHARRARQLPWRTAFTFTPGSDSSPKLNNPVLISKQPPPIIFVFTGQGPQHINMGRQLFKAYQVFRDTILELDQLYENVVGVSLIQSTGLFTGQDTSLLPAIWSAEATIPAITMVQIALYDLMKSVGLTPNVIVGHSAGETALIYASGAGSKAMAFEIAIARARAMKLSEISDAGMAALACDAEWARSIIEHIKPEGVEGVLEIACYNSPSAIVLSGSTHLVEEAVQAAQLEGIFARKLSTLNPSHSCLMDVCRETFFGGVCDIFRRYEGPHIPKLPTYSSVAGQEKIIKEFTPEYLWSNLRNPVHFHQAISSILEDFTTHAAFVEISPHPALSSYITALEPTLTVTCPMRRPSKNTSGSNVELVAFTEALGRFISLGINSVDLTSLYGHACRDKAYNIPYPFTARHFPQRVDGPRQIESSSGSYSLRQKMNARTHPDLAQHIINGEPIVPAAAYIDMVLQSGARLLWDLEFNSILSLASEAPADVRVEHDGIKWNVKTSQHGSSKSPGEFRIHSQGFSSNNVAPPVPSVDLASIKDRLEPLTLNGFYESLQPLVNFGPIFQRLVSLVGNPDEALAEVTVPSENARKYICNPMVLDAAIHFAAFHADVVQNPNPGSVFLPSRLGAFAFYEAPRAGEHVFSHMLMREWTPDTRIFDFNLYDSWGSAICTMHDLELREVPSTPAKGVTTRYDLIYQPISINIGLLHPKSSTTAHDVNNLHDLLNVLDHFALDFLANLLREDLPQTNKLHRKRYLEFAKEALERGTPYPPSFAEIEGLRSRWPVCFEMTEQLAVGSKNLFNSLDGDTTTIFPRNMILRFFRSQQIFDSVLDEMKSIFEQTLSTICAEGKRILRVLEVGAGKGSPLTSYLCEALRTREDIMVEYVASDPSLEMARAAIQGTTHEHIRPQTYNLSRDPEEQGLKPNTFDIIVGFNTLHTLPDIEAALLSLNRLLVPGGLLLMAELDGTSWKEKPGSIWIDCVFGVFQEWFCYTDERERCILTPEGWKSKLQQTCYDNVQTLGSEPNGLAFVFTAQCSRIMDLANVPCAPKTAFLHYKYGDEMILQRKLSEFDVNETLALWLIADDGIDGHAGLGLVQTIIHEFPSWDIRLSIFEATLEEPEQIAKILRCCCQLGDDTVVRFTKDGRFFVPKVVKSLPPRAVDFDPRGAWINRGTDIIQIHLGRLEQYQAMIEVSAWSNPASSFHGFVGSIVNSGDGGLLRHQKVIGISQAPLANRIVCHSGHFAVLPDTADGDFLAEYALAAVITTMILGPARMTEERQGRPRKQICVADSDDSEKVLQAFLGTIPALADVSSGDPPRDAQIDVIIASSSTLAARPEIRSWRGRVLVWDDVVRDMLEGDPWSVGDALHCGLQLSTPAASPGDSRIIRPMDLLSNSTRTLVFNESRPLFDANKAYILLGGISDLGIYVALWMYQHGARNMILTSRRGRGFFDSHTYTPTKQRLAYLNKREDVHLRLESCDALSHEATSALIDSIKQPIGGCFLMTLVLADALFMNQTEESFKKVCATKLKVLETFTAVLAIERLDFFVSFSSIVALLGNLGQSNYTISHNLVDGILEKHTNAFSLMVPGVSQIGVLARAGSRAIEAKHLGQWSMTPDEICDCLGDGLLKVYQGIPITRYIPELKWDKVEEFVGLSSMFKHLLLPQEDNSDDVKQDNTQVLAMILNLLGVSPEDFSVDVPFVAYGLDSLGATRIAEALRPYVNISQMQLLGGLTWNKLQERFHVTADDSAIAEGPSTSSMLDMVAKYSIDFGSHVPLEPTPVDTGDVILITGTTGAVGASVLAELVNFPAVGRIYALNRKSTDGRSLYERQKQAFEAKGLDPVIIESPKINLLEGDLTVPDFNLEIPVLEQLLSSVTHIIHVAWNVNWNHDLAMMEPNVRGTRNLIDLALLSTLPSPPRFVFVSTVVVVRQHVGKHEYMDERFSSAELALGSGYAESKWVAERLLELVATQTSLRPVVVRVGQISGGRDGYWNPNEWLPSIVQSAKNVGCLPDSMQTISWIPLEVVATSLVELRNSTTSVLHLVHPRPISWRAVFTRISQILKVPLVSYEEWVTRLGKQLAVLPEKELENTPALKLLDAFRKVKLDMDEEKEAGTPKVSIAFAIKESAALAHAKEITLEDVDRWLSYWTKLGMI